MSYASVDLGLVNKSTLGIVPPEHKPNNKHHGQVDLERGCEALTDLQRYISSTSEKKPQGSSGSLETKAQVNGTENASTLEKLQSELSDAKITGQLIGDDSSHTTVILREMNVYASSDRTSIWHGLVRLLPSCVRNQLPRTISGQHNEVRIGKVPLLKNFSGIIRPGEMVLVLGRPGSGCTTFLKAVSGYLDLNCFISGELRHLPPDSAEKGDLLSDQTIFCPASDVHMPTLTVRQTLKFAVNSKLAQHDAKSQKHVLESIMQIFNISHQASTLVGDALIRGISGGEKKRVSIAEALLSRPSVACWDNSTLGLDAGSAADFVRCLRILTDTYKMTTFAALYQASDNLYKLFDKVLVIENGYQVYFGPASEAKDYFVQLGFPYPQSQPIADYLTDCVDPRHKNNEVHVQPSELARIYKESTPQDEIINQPAITFRGDSSSFFPSHERIRERKPSLPFHKQVYLTARRHAALRLQDKLGLAVKAVTATVVAIVVGTMYWQLPKTSAGAFTRGGVIFITLLYNAFTAFVELPSAIIGRPVLQKHNALGFHSRSALYLGQFCVDVPLAAVEILIFVLIVYFMAGLTLSVGAFFTFYILVVLGQATMSVFFRTLGCISKTMDSALRLASIIIMLMILSSGYMVPYPDIKPAVRWFYWLNPLAYDFAAIMLNEFKGLTMRCVQQNLIPNGLGYNDTASQVCTLPGSLPRDTYVGGENYLLAAFGFAEAHLNRNIGIMVVFVVGLLVTNIGVAEFVIFGSSSMSIKTFIKWRQKASDAEISSQRQAPSESVDLVASRSVVTWEEISYKVPVSRGSSKQLLHNIDGFIEPGTLLALMGPSGQGSRLSVTLVK